MKIILNPSVEDALLQKVKETAPDAEVVMVASSDDAVAQMADTDVVFGTYNREMVRAGMGTLKWIQTTSAGMDGSRIPPELKDSDIQVCNASGVHAIQVAEQAFALTMALIRGLHQSVVFQRNHEWKRPVLDDLYNCTIGIIGFGGIGRKYAEQCAAFQSRILALDVQGGDKPDHVEALWDMSRLNDVVEQADIVFIACPHTPETDKLINADLLKRMKKSAYLVNTARGGIVDEAALIEGLKDGEIAGAGLDVFEKEPLSPDSPLWDMKNVFVTPHAAGSSPKRHHRTVGFFCENLKRFMAGEPLQNEIDKNVGYPTIDKRADDIRTVDTTAGD